MRYGFDAARAFRSRLLMTVVWLPALTGQLRVPAEPLKEAEGPIRQVTGQSTRVVVRPDLTGELDQTWRADGSGRWTLADDALVLESAGVPAGPIRRPAALALLRDHVFGGVTVEAEVRSTAEPSVTRADVLIVFGYQSPTRFYYVHLSGVTDAVHNGIFVVDDADRRRIDEPTSTPQLVDRNWHRVRLERDPANGRIAVYADGSPQPVLETTDRTFTSGFVGFGSFDDTGIIRNIVISGTLTTRRD